MTVPKLTSTKMYENHEASPEETGNAVKQFLELMNKVDSTKVRFLISTAGIENPENEAGLDGHTLFIGPPAAVASAMMHLIEKLCTHFSELTPLLTLAMFRELGKHYPNMTLDQAKEHTVKFVDQQINYNKHMEAASSTVSDVLKKFNTPSKPDERKH